MYETIVGDDVRHREHAVMSLFRQHVAARAGQRPPRRHELVMHPVYPLNDRTRAGQVELGHRRARQHAGPAARADERTNRWRIQLHIGVQINPRKPAAGLVTQPQRVGLARHIGLDDPDAVHLVRVRGGAVAACVGDHDDIELAGRRSVQQPPQVGCDDRLLVVCRDDDADRGLTHLLTIASTKPEPAAHE
jgi:hypothetical protein